MRAVNNKHFKSIVLSVLFWSLSAAFAFAESEKTKDYFYNPPEFVREDPNYTPGDYPLEDTNQARMAYYLQKDELADAFEKDPALLVSLDTGEITFTSVKNGSKPVQGYFKNYFATAKLGPTGIQSFKMIVDVNSLDTAVPGRNNRILDLLFQSMRPEFGTAVFNLENADPGVGPVDKLEPGKQYPMKAEGNLTLNGITKPVTVSLLIQKNQGVWKAETSESFVLKLSDFGFTERAYALMKACNHKSLKNEVEIRVKLYFK